MASRRGSKKPAGKSPAPPAEQTKAEGAATVETTAETTAAEVSAAEITPDSSPDSGKDSDVGKTPAERASATAETTAAESKSKPGMKTTSGATAKPAAAKDDGKLADARITDAKPADAKTADAKLGAATASAKATMSAKADRAGWTKESNLAPSAGASAGDTGDFDPYRDDDLRDVADDDLGHSVLDDPHHEEGRSLAGTALSVVLGVLFVAGLTLWAAPKLAPHLPAGVAKYLMPGEMQAAGRLAALEEALAKQSEKAEAGVSALQAELAALAGRSDTDAGAEAAQIAEAAKAAAENAAADAAALASHLATVDQELAGLRNELTAMSTALGDAAEGASAAPAELAASLAALGARLDKVAAAVEEGAAAQALEQQLAGLTARLDAIESSAADAKTQQRAALNEVETALQTARLQAALDVLASRLTNGLPYGAKLNEVAGMSGKPPSEALSAGAANGVANAAELEATFSRFANAAVAADVRVESGEGALGALGWLQSQVAGRPVDEQEGDTVGAVTSRIGARISEGDLTAALAEADALPEHAQAGLGRWLERLRARVAAEAALETWRADIGVGG